MTVRAHEALHGDKIDTPQGLGVIEQIEVSPEPGYPRLIVRVRNPLGMLLVAKVTKLFAFAIYRTGACGKRACEAHHADRGPGAQVCADHWRVA